MAFEYLYLLTMPSAESLVKNLYRPYEETNKFFMCSKEQRFFLRSKLREVPLKVDRPPAKKVLRLILASSLTRPGVGFSPRTYLDNTTARRLAYVSPIAWLLFNQLRRLRGARAAYSGFGPCAA